MSERPEFKQGTFPKTIKLSEGAKNILLDLAEMVAEDKDTPVTYQDDCLSFISQVLASPEDRILITDDKGMCGYIEASMMVKLYVEEN